MGYESRYIVVDRCEYEFGRDGDTKVHAEVLATFSMSRMPIGFDEPFKEEIDYELYPLPQEAGYVDTDKYGDHLKYSTLDDMIAWLKKAIKTNSYRRLMPLLGYLQGLDPEDWEEIQIVHYGY